MLRMIVTLLFIFLFNSSRLCAAEASQSDEKGIEMSAEKVEKGVKKAAEKTGKGITKAVEKTGKALEKAGKKVKKHVIIEKVEKDEKKTD